MDSDIAINETCVIDCSYEPIDLPFLLQSPTGSEGGQKSRPKQKSYRKKVETVWSHESIVKLIEEVKIRRSLWDAGCAEYKLPKDSLWQEVADAIQVSLNDCKGKWTNLRISFNCNLEKYRKKKSDQGTDEQFQIVWRYFKPMMFLETRKVRQTTQSISSTQLESANTDESIVCDMGFTDELRSTSPCTSGQQRNSKSAITTSSSSGRKADVKEMATESLQSLQSSDSQMKDTLTVFGEYIAAELRNLSPESAAFARSKLRRAFSDILDEVSLMKNQEKMNPTNNLETRQCRTCYDTKKELKPLTDLTKCGASGQLISFAEMLDNVCRINIMDNFYKELPQFICEVCLSKLKAAQSFIQQSQELNERLISLLDDQKEINNQLQNLVEPSVVIKMEYDEPNAGEGSETPWYIKAKPDETIGFQNSNLNDDLNLNDDVNAKNDTASDATESKDSHKSAVLMHITQTLGVLSKKLDLLTENHELFKNELKDIKNQNSLVISVLSENTDVIEKSLNKNPKYVKMFPIASIEDLKEIEESINEQNETEYISSIRAIAGQRGLKKGLADILAAKLLVDFNVDGSHNKQRLLNYPKFVNVLFHGTYDENCTEKSFKCNLRDALKLVKNRYFKEKFKFKEKDSGFPKENSASNDGDIQDD